MTARAERHRSDRTRSRIGRTGLRAPSVAFSMALLLIGPGCSDPNVGGAELPTVPAPTGSECADPARDWIWCDDFEVDRFSSYFEAQMEGGSLARAPAVGVEDSWGLRVRWEAGQVAAGNLKLAFGRTPDDYFRPVDDGSRDYREIYWRVWLRNQPGWTGGGGHKLSRAMSFATGAWAQAMMAHVWSSGEGNLLLAIDPASGTTEAGQLASTVYNDFDNWRWLGIARSSTAVFASDHIGSWHCVEAHVRLNDPGSQNGTFELWIDGALEASRTELNWVGSFQSYGINSVFLENYWDGGPPVAQERYFDGFVVSTAPIGC